MPIPFIVWGGAAAVAAYLAWCYWKEIDDFFKSEDGKKLLDNVGKAFDTAMEPYKKIIDESMSMETTKRRLFFKEAKSRMAKQSWAALVGYGKGLVQQDTRYFAAIVDLEYVNDDD